MDHFAQYFLHSDQEDFIIKGELLREEYKTFNSNRNIKDSVFRLLFDEEENLLSLFNALEDTHYTKKEDIRINTLKGAIFNNVRNDLSFSVEDCYLSIIEHQSTMTENSPLRMFVYLGRVYEQILDISKAYRRRLYRVPVPRLHLLYNGVEDFPQEKRYRLSKAFRMPQENTMVELEVLAININIEKKHPILERCPVLKEYSLFIGRIRSKRQEGKNQDAAVKEAIRECMEENILREFLQRHGKEVYNMMFDEITYDDILRIRVEEAEEEARERGLSLGIKQGIEQGIEQGIAQGREQGVEQGIASFILGFSEEGFSKQKIVKKLKEHFRLSEAEAQKYYNLYAAH